jgi:hypothetical protein
VARLGTRREPPTARNGESETGFGSTSTNHDQAPEGLPESGGGRVHPPPAPRATLDLSWSGEADVSRMRLGFQPWHGGDRPVDVENRADSPASGAICTVQGLWAPPGRTCLGGMSRPVHAAER